MRKIYHILAILIIANLSFAQPWALTKTVVKCVTESYTPPQGYSVISAVHSYNGCLPSGQLTYTIAPNAVFLDESNINKNVGIGIAIPTAKLHVNGVGGGNIDFIVNGRMKSDNNDGGLWVASDRFIGGHDVNKIGFFNNGDWRMSVLNNGNIGVGTTSPKASLDVATDISNGKLGTIFGRLPEGNAVGDGTFLGVKGYATNSSTYGGKSFGIEHAFYGQVNSSINFFRGGSQTGGYITFNTNNNTERMRIDENGNVRINNSLSMGGDINLTTSKLSINNPTTDDPFSIEQVVYGTEKSEYRISLGNDASADDFLSFGTYAPGTTNWRRFAKLNTLGEFYAKKVVVTQLNWADHVFDANYKMPSLAETETYIKTHKHLPGIPSEKEIAEKGIDTGEMLKLQMAKIEELTLLLIQQQKEIDELKHK